MTKDEALKLTLEALEEYVNVVVSVNDPNEWTPKVADAGEPARKAITAIKEALAQRTWVGLTDEDELDWDGGDLKSLVKAIEAKLKEKNT